MKNFRPSGARLIINLPHRKHWYVPATFVSGIFRKNSIWSKLSLCDEVEHLIFSLIRFVGIGISFVLFLLLLRCSD